MTHQQTKQNKPKRQLIIYIKETIPRHNSTSRNPLKRDYSVPKMSQESRNLSDDPFRQKFNFPRLHSSLVSQGTLFALSLLKANAHKRPWLRTITFNGVELSEWRETMKGMERREWNCFIFFIKLALLLIRI